MMKKKLKIGDRSSIRSATLFGLETYLRKHLNDNPDDNFHVKTFAWGREGFGQDEGLGKVISFIEPPKPVDIPKFPDDSNVRQYEWVIYIQGMLPDNSEIPTYPSYEMVNEIKRILYSLIEANTGMNAVNNILNLGPKAQRDRGMTCNVFELKIGAETVRGPGEHSAFAFFWLPIHIGIVEDLKNPWVQIQDPL